EELRKHDLLPILFDFEKPDNRDLTGTVQTLANMARFIIADLTDPSCVPHELASALVAPPRFRSATVLRGFRFRRDSAVASLQATVRLRKYTRKIVRRGYRWCEPSHITS